MLYIQLGFRKNTKRAEVTSVTMGKEATSTGAGGHPRREGDSVRGDQEY